MQAFDAELFAGRFRPASNFTLIDQLERDLSPEIPGTFWALGLVLGNSARNIIAHAAVEGSVSALNQIDRPGFYCFRHLNPGSFEQGVFG